MKLVLKMNGSSPLARGLRSTPSWFRMNHGIIPARAGFTVRLHPRREDRPDHPRSRGVYSVADHSDPSGLGSSPLARGLLRARGAGVAGRRIIPARAGFTSSSRTRHGAEMDHPRSRGVYEYDVQRLVDKAGSSPLARGLLWKSNPRPALLWIIPARAGFTPISIRRRTGPSGSSPLARGLP